MIDQERVERLADAEFGFLIADWGMVGPFFVRENWGTYMRFVMEGVALEVTLDWMDETCLVGVARNAPDVPWPGVDVVEGRLVRAYITAVAQATPAIWERSSRIANQTMRLLGRKGKRDTAYLESLVSMFAQELRAFGAEILPSALQYFDDYNRGDHSRQSFV